MPEPAAAEIRPEPDKEKVRQHLVISAIEACLGDFIVHLDVSRDLLTQVGRIKADPPESVKTASKPLPGPLRKELDQILASADESVPQLLEQTMASLEASMPAESHEDDRVTHHPPTADELAAAHAWLSEQANVDEHFGELFREHRDNPDAMIYLQAKMDERSRKHLPERLLGEALLPIMVSRLEELLKALLRVGLRLHPKSLGGLPEIPPELLDKYADKSDLRRWQIDRKVADFFKGTPEDWRKGLTKWPKVDLAQQAGSWDVIVEAIQRRHVLVHNGGRADHKYIEVAGRGTDKFEGQLLVCDPDYLRSVFSNFEALALSLSVRWINAFKVASPAAGGFYPPMLDRVVDGFERAGQWSMALAVLDAIMEQPLEDMTRKETVQINIWYCLQELGRQDDAMLGSIYAWQPSDVESRMARAALLRDEPYALSVLKEVNAEARPAFVKRHLREAPLIRRFMKENVRVNKGLSR